LGGAQSDDAALQERVFDLKAPPTAEHHLRLLSSQPPDHIHRRERLGGLINEYALAA
jgi:hypothetical protein